MTTSVLMSTYCKERPEYLNMSLDSIWTAQIHRPDEIILVEDGPLTADLYSVINEWKNKLGERLVLVVNKENQGLARSLNNGLKHANGDIIVRMDSDDIAYPERIKENIEAFETINGLDVVGSWISEFIETPDNVTSLRKVPETLEEIYRFGKYRNPMNHPSVSFRKDRIMQAGGYTHFLLFEDYHLWVTLLMKGYRFYNIQKPLVWFRSSGDMFARRGGFDYAVTEQRFLYFMYKTGYISFAALVRNTLTRFAVRLLPNRLRKFAYYRFAR